MAVYESFTKQDGSLSQRRANPCKAAGIQSFLVSVDVNNESSGRFALVPLVSNSHGVISFQAHGLQSTNRTETRGKLLSKKFCGDWSSVKSADAETFHPVKATIKET